jgi:hypothetical protein
MFDTAKITELLEIALEKFEETTDDTTFNKGPILTYRGKSSDF